LSPDQVNPPRWQRFRIVTWGQRRRMTWLLVLLAWTVCAAVVAPFVGRVLAHGGVVERRSRPPAHHRSLPTRRRPLVLH
jgi:hypothetical protein